MDPLVAITGLGLCTPLGTDVEQTWTALLAGDSIYSHALAMGMDSSCRARAIQMALAVSQQALAPNDQSIALVVGTSKGTIIDWLTPAATTLPLSLASINTNLARQLNLPNGPRLTLSAACASGLHALIRATMLIHSGIVQRALVVATEASVHPLFIGSFQRLGVLAPEGTPCKPFDQQRDGFLISEAAAAVMLEAINPDQRSRAHAIVDRFAIGSDATHLTGSDPQGRTLRRLIRSVVAEQDFDLVHAHATATTSHDPIELAAIEDEVPGSPAIYSHKGALGHSLGASGLVSIVLNSIMHGRGVIPGNIHTTFPLPTRNATIPQQNHPRPIRRSLAVAAGFGGAIAAVSLRS